MTRSSEKQDYAASVRQRLLNLAKKDNVDFDLVLKRFAGERFLYRLGLSSEVDRFTLKGASLFVVWTDEVLRPTRDIDLLSYGASEREDVRSAIENICSVACPEDGLIFDLDSLRLDEIRDEHDYGGIRARIKASLGQARIAQIGRAHV